MNDDTAVVANSPQHAETQDAQAAPAPAIYALAPGLSADGLEAWLDQAARLGFDHVLLPVPFPAAGAEAAPLVQTHDVLAAPLRGEAAPGLRALAASCRARNLAVLIDVVVDRIAAGGPLAAAAGEVFAAPDLASLPDPRGAIAAEDVALARAGTADAAARLGAWWGARLAAWQEAGIAGFRLLGLSRLPADALAPFIVALRAAAPQAMLCGWTPGIAWPALDGLVGAGLDFVFPSLAWWDWQSAWLWQETGILASVAKLIACPRAADAPAPPGALDPALAARRARREILFAAGFGTGWMLPMGLEYGRPVDGDITPQQARAAAGFDLAAEVSGANAARAADPALRSPAPPRLLSGPGAPVLAVLRTDTADPRRARRAALLLANAGLEHRRPLALDQVLATIGQPLGLWRQMLLPDAAPLSPQSRLVLAPGEVRLATAAAPAVVRDAAPPAAQSASLAAQAPRIGIEDVTPRVDGGDFPAKRTVGELVVVEADVICDGHDQLGVALRWRAPGEEGWAEARMRPLGNDRWQAHLPLTTLGTWRFLIEAWRDAFASFRDELGKKHKAGVDTLLELQEGLDLVGRSVARAPAGARASVAALHQRLQDADTEVRRAMLLADETAAIMAAADDCPFAARSGEFTIAAERIGARFASWYEIFPRSMSDDASRHGTFADVQLHLPRIRAMGFDVLYFPPIHPIGRTNRKGRNNSLTPAPEDPGSPYAIGADAGGHDALHPELGTLEDFRALIAAAARHGLEIALDFAIQCSPDHPWLRQHRGWFDWRPDGTIRYAENPPKKYEDIVNVDFYAPEAIPGLWLALCNVVLFWAAQGVRLFRVDNPHTKPLPFWQWMIATVKARYPDTAFLAEAFTRPKVMYRLAKVGFSQSYTYFTWRDTKRELQDYLEELTTTAPKEFFRPHFFVNTPDINPVFLQNSGRPGFLIRAALAATLSGLWGVYNGFELCEARALPGREEYADSEKYQIRVRDHDRPGNIRAEITELNRLRRENPALQSHLTVTFHNAGNDAILYYEKATADRSNVLLVAVSLDPHQAQEADIEVPLWQWQLPDSASVAVEDLLGGATFNWAGKIQHVRLTPERPYAIWRVRPV